MAKTNEFNSRKNRIKGIFVILGLVLCVIFVYFNIFDSIITNLVGHYIQLFGQLNL